MTAMRTGAPKILIMAPTWLGDTVMSLPLISRLSASGARVVVLADRYAARTYLGLDEVDELVVLPRSLRQRARAIRRLRVAGGALLAPSFSSALTLFLSGVSVRVGYATDGRSLLLSDALTKRGIRSEHLVENYTRIGSRLLRRLGMELAEAAAPVVRVFEPERQRVRVLLEERGVGGDYAVVVPGATYGPTKSWPVEKYRELVGRLSSELAVVLAGGPAERRLCDKVRGDAEHAFNLAGDTTLGELFALVEGARVVIANDSGVPHVSGSLGVPTVVIFGSTSPTWTRPQGQAVTVVREPVPCAPCFLRTCPTQLECYEGIGVERVADAAAGVAGRVHAPAGNGSK